MAKPTAIVGAVIDLAPANDLGALTSMIGFSGDEETGLVTGSEGQEGAIHAIGSSDTEVPGVIGGEAVPENTAVPTISGTATQGSTLTGAPGTWTGIPVPALTYQWLGDDVALVGATALTLVLGAPHVGMVIKFRVTGTNIYGSDVGTSAGTSAVT